MNQAQLYEKNIFINELNLKIRVQVSIERWPADIEFFFIFPEMHFINSNIFNPHELFYNVLNLLFYLM